MTQEKSFSFLSKLIVDKRSTILDHARQVLKIESQAVAGLADRIGPEFERAVEIIYQSTGRVIVTGIGKSGLVAQKIAATLTSTGTSAIFMHPADAVHGDLGMVLRNDVVICVTKSGNTGELTRLLPIFKKLGVPIVTLTGNLRSALASRSDVVLDVSVREEACPNDLAPTASTTAAMAMGDALAIALLEKRDFKAEDFAFLHPGGSLGKKLLKIDEVMFSGDKVPIVRTDTPLHEVILEITRKRFGGTCVVDEKGRLVGIITDGDLRRLLQRPNKVDKLTAQDIMNVNPKTVRKNSMALKALQLMENHNIMQVVIVDSQNRPIGMAHLHDLLEIGNEKE
jgi:arabinose-5-phosphate isomerase